MPPANAFNRKAKHSRVVRVFTTADDDIEEDSEVQVFTGQLSRNAPKGTRGSSELARRMFQRMEKSSSLRVLKPEAFAELWQSLDDAGLFKIPRSRLKKPPTDRSYFQVKTDGKEWIFSRPEVRVAGPDQPRTKYREYWGNAKRALVAFENGL